MLDIGITQSSSWNTHCLLTRAALSAPKSYLNESVPVVELGEFLARGEQHINDIAGEYRELVKHKSGVPTGTIANDPSRMRTWSDLAAALGLNPVVQLHYVRTLRQEEFFQPPAHDPSREGPPGGMYVETTPGETIEAKEIVCTYADEPDWGMDQDLFPVAEYGYGSPPFGPPTGKSSQAAFHMAFLHGPRVLKLLVPHLGTSFMAERVEVFLALSKLAFETGLTYWGWRFAAWAMHYLQDLTQPYHATPFPPSMWRTFIQIVRQRGHGHISRRIGTLLKNHHLVFEATVHLLLNDESKGRKEGELKQALALVGRNYQGSIAAVMDDCSLTPSRLANAVDRMMMNLFPVLRICDEGTMSIDAVVEGIEDTVKQVRMKNPAYFDRWVTLMCRCLTGTGDVTRYAMEKACNPLRSPKSH